MNELDVVVVGGGPAGSTAATLCAQRGRRVVVLEHKHFPRHKVCGDVINPNSWPVLERTGGAAAIRALPRHECRGARFTASTGAVIDVPMRSVAIRRSLFDAALLDHARACGVTVIEGETVHEIDPRWRIVIGADGRHSGVARNAGLLRGGSHNGHIAFQAHFRAPAGLDDWVQLHLFPTGYCGVVRVDDEHINLCIVTDRTGAQLHDDCEALFARTVWQNPGFRALGILPEPLEPLASAHPLQRAMNVPCRDGVFLVGDALRVTEPFTGQGIFFALRTAELAAEAICDGRDYAADVRALYRQRGQTNEWLRRLMYREPAAARTMAVLQRLPAAQRWLAGNVLAGERAASR